MWKEPRCTWPGPYPECHDSPAAYGNLVARRLGARFVTFACSGASYLNGVVAPQTRTVQHVDPDLTLTGLQILYARRAGSAGS